MKMWRLEEAGVQADKTAFPQTVTIPFESRPCALLGPLSQTGSSSATWNVRRPLNAPPARAEFHIRQSRQDLTRLIWLLSSHQAALVWWCRSILSCFYSHFWIYSISQFKDLRTPPPSSSTSLGYFLVTFSMDPPHCSTQGFPPLSNSICSSLYYFCLIFSTHSSPACLLLPSFLLVSQKQLSHVTITPAAIMSISSSFYSSFAHERNNCPHLTSVEAELLFPLLRVHHGCRPPVTSLTSGVAAVAETVFWM